VQGGRERTLHFISSVLVGIKTPEMKGKKCSPSPGTRASQPQEGRQYFLSRSTFVVCRSKKKKSKPAVKIKRNGNEDDITQKKFLEVETPKKETAGHGGSTGGAGGRGGKKDILF